MKEQLSVQPGQSVLTIVRRSVNEGFAAWHQFWFDPLDPLMLGIMRLLTGWMLFYNLLVWSLQLETFFGRNGVQPLETVKRLYESRFVFSFWLWIDDQYLWPVHIACIIVAALFCVGAATRLTSIAAFLITISYSQRVPVANFGFDQILGMMCLYLALAPSGAAVSVDNLFRNWWRHRKGRALDSAPARFASARMATRLIQLHLCAIYFWAGFAKLKGSTWWTGEAMWNVIANQEYQTVDLTWMAWIPWLPYLIAHITIAWEVFFIVLVWNRRLRPLMLAMGTVMHLGIGAFLGMWTFGLIMTFAYLSFADPEIWRKSFAGLSRRLNLRNAAANPASVMLLACMTPLLSGCAKAPDSPEILLERAKILMERGRVAEAIPFLDRSVKAMPQNPDAWYQRGLAYESLDLPEKALDDYAACLKLDKLRTDALNNKAVQLAMLKRYDEALVVFSELVDLDRDDFLGYRNRGLCRFDMHDNDGALQDYATALKLNPQDPSSWFQRGKVHLSMNSLDAAEGDFSKAVELDPQFAKAWMNRGIVRFQRGEKALAAADLTKAQELDSNIVLPGIGVFSDTDPSSVATQSVEATVWHDCRPLIEKDLTERGFRELVFVREYPDLLCAELTAAFDGQPGKILVTCQQTGQSTVTLPCPDHPADSGSEELPCSLLVLQLSGSNGAVAEVARFEREWNPHVEDGEPVIMNYHL